jgi:outer membrane lipoprotein-sorting protein
MRKRSTIILALLVLATTVTGSLWSQTAQDVLKKMIEADGGEKTLAAIKDSTMTGTMEMIQMGMNGSITMYQKEPTMMRMDIEVMGMVITQAYDGEKGWWVNPQTGASEELPDAQAQELKRQAYGNDTLLHPEKYGITYELKGTEKVDDKDCIVLEQSFKDGNKNTLLLDKDTYLPYKTRTKALNQMGVEVQSETTLSDYKTVEGVPVPHSITIYQDGQEFMKMTVTKVTYNSGLEDSFFKMTK